MLCHNCCSWTDKAFSDECKACGKHASLDTSMLLPTTAQCYIDADPTHQLLSGWPVLRQAKPCYKAVQSPVDGLHERLEVNSSTTSQSFGQFESHGLHQAGYLPTAMPVQEEMRPLSQNGTWPEQLMLAGAPTLTDRWRMSDHDQGFQNTLCTQVNALVTDDHRAGFEQAVRNSGAMNHLTQSFPDTIVAFQQWNGSEASEDVSIMTPSGTTTPTSAANPVHTLRTSLELDKMTRGHTQTCSQSYQARIRRQRVVLEDFLRQLRSAFSEALHPGAAGRMVRALLSPKGATHAGRIACAEYVASTPSWMTGDTTVSPVSHSVADLLSESHARGQNSQKRRSCTGEEKVLIRRRQRKAHKQRVRALELSNIEKLRMLCVLVLERLPSLWGSTKELTMADEQLWAIWLGLRSIVLRNESHWEILLAAESRLVPSSSGRSRWLQQHSRNTFGVLTATVPENRDASKIGSPDRPSSASSSTARMSSLSELNLIIHWASRTRL